MDLLGLEAATRDAAPELRQHALGGLQRALHVGGQFHALAHGREEALACHVKSRQEGVDAIVRSRAYSRPAGANTQSSSEPNDSSSQRLTLGAEGGEEERNPEQRLARRPVPIRVRVDGLSGWLKVVET